MIDIDMEDDDEDGENRFINMDGGVAVNPEGDASKAKKLSENCDLLLYVYCDEPIDWAPDHPIMRPGVTVSIGLDKTTKLKTVFQRYVDFCNTISEAEYGGHKNIFLMDLEFAFCQVLNENDTAETSALMKNDRIKVRKIRTDERAKEAEQKRALRDADREYFRQMRHLLPESCPARIADVRLDCRGKLVDKNGRNQRVLSTTVRAHSSLINKRCSWLMATILQARQKAKREAIDQENPENSETPEHSPMRVAEIENDDEAENGDCNINAAASDDAEKEIGSGEEGISAPAQIDIVDGTSDARKVNVVDDDEDDAEYVVSSSHNLVLSRPESNVLTVVLNDHSPEAVKILLEYCYTNRVVSLGHEAFVQACKTKPSKTNGPVHPYHASAKRWPNTGIPSVPFSVALAAIRLAEEAGMHRLSLMCEISAAQLVSSNTVVEALTMSTLQKNISGNDLPRLRRAAMDIIFRRGRRGVSEIGKSTFFIKALEEKKSIIVPTLLKGTMEVVTHWEKTTGVKRASSDLNFKKLDKEDADERAEERKKRRRERMGRNLNKIREQDEDNGSDCSAEEYDEELCERQIIDWAAGASKKVRTRALARMTHHSMDSIKREVASRGMKLAKANKSLKRSSRSSSSRSHSFFGPGEK
uniref:BTB domain-containing protein n=1 Tax=Pseudo-nitzschia australis TaxID=44445 RepID=A0A7S4ADE7_9STRA